MCGKARVYYCILDLVEEALSRYSVLVRVLRKFLGSSLMQFPVAAQNQEKGNLHAENDSGGREGGGEILNALVFFSLGGTRAGRVCRLWASSAGHGVVRRGVAKAAECEWL